MQKLSPSHSPPSPQQPLPSVAPSLTPCLNPDTLDINIPKPTQVSPDPPAQICQIVRPGNICMNDLSTFDPRKDKRDREEPYLGKAPKQKRSQIDLTSAERQHAVSIECSSSILTATPHFTSSGDPLFSFANYSENTIFIRKSVLEKFNQDGALKLQPPLIHGLLLWKPRTLPASKSAGSNENAK